MSAAIDKAIDDARTIAEPALKDLVEDLKAQFLAAFGELKNAIHKEKVGKLFQEAAQVKLRTFVTKDQEDQRKLARVYELKLAAIETYVLGAKVVADAKAASLFKEVAKQILDTLGKVATVILKTVVTGLVQGAVAGFTGGAGGVLATSIANAVESFRAGPDAA